MATIITTKLSPSWEGYHDLPRTMDVITAIVVTGVARKGSIALRIGGEEVYRARPTTAHAEALVELALCLDHDDVFRAILNEMPTAAHLITPCPGLPFVDLVYNAVHLALGGGGYHQVTLRGYRYHGYRFHDKRSSIGRFTFDNKAWWRAHGNVIQRATMRSAGSSIRRTGDTTNPTSSHPNSSTQNCIADDTAAHWSSSVAAPSKSSGAKPRSCTIC